MDPQYIFLLLPSADIPNWFTKLSHNFGNYGISLVPVRFDQLKKLIEMEESIHVISITGFFKEKQWLKRVVKRYLGFVIKQRKIHFYHITTFDQLNEFNPMKKRGHYNYVKMPIKASSLATIVSEAYFARGGKNIWPGGKKVGVPVDSLI